MGTVRLALVMTNVPWVPSVTPHGSDTEIEHWGTVMLANGAGRVMVDTEVVVRWLEVPTTYPIAVPASIATTNEAAIAPFFMSQRVPSWGVKFYS